MPAAPADSIFTSCRKGDLARVQYLVEKKEVDLNVRDCWDSTPLYYACQCGHHDLVQYLLANGARCEANTFDGERCLYGALTNRIKRLLLDSKIVNSSSKRRDEFDEFCERMMRAEEYSDLTITVGDKKYKVHRCLLSARSEYFCHILHTKWKAKKGIRTNYINSSVFDEFLKYLYTGRIACDVDQVIEICELSKNCKVQHLTEYLTKAQRQSEFFGLSKKRVKISTLIVDTPHSRTDLLEDFGVLLDPGLPGEFAVNPFYRFKTITGYMDSEVKEIDPIFDLYLLVDGAKFYCNKVFVCTRSEYFAALCMNHFMECKEENGKPVITLRNVSASVVMCVLYYIYTNSPTSLNENIVLEVLEAADIYLLPGLKKHCTTYLCTLLSQDNIIDMLNLARMHDLGKLEDSCAGYIARNIEAVSTNEEFRKFVLHDAQEVKGRQETDSIPIIDDIRYHISSEVGTFSDVEGAHEKLKLIDDLLDDLGLEA